MKKALTSVSRTVLMKFSQNGKLDTKAKMLTINLAIDRLLTDVQYKLPTILLYEAYKD